MKTTEKASTLPHPGPRAYWRFRNPQLGTEDLIKRETVQSRQETPTPVQSVLTGLRCTITAGYVYSVMMWLSGQM